MNPSETSLPDHFLPDFRYSQISNRRSATTRTIDPDSDFAGPVLPPTEDNRNWHPPSLISTNPVFRPPISSNDTNLEFSPFLDHPGIDVDRDESRSGGFYASGTRFSKLNRANRKEVAEILRSEEYNSLKNPYYLQPFSGKLAVTLLSGFDNGLVFVTFMHIILGLILGCAWFFFTRIEVVQAEIQAQSFYQAFYAINFLVAFVVGVRFAHAFNSSAEASENYLKLKSDIEWLSLSAASMLRHSMEYRGTMSTESKSRIIKIKMVLLALAYHSYSCMTLSGFFMDKTYIKFMIYRGESYLDPGLVDPTVSIARSSEIGESSKLFEYYDLLMQNSDADLAPRLPDAPPPEKNVSDSQITFSNVFSPPEENGPINQARPWFKLSALRPDPSIRNCYIYDSNRDRTYIGPLDVAARMYSSLVTEVSPDENGYDGWIYESESLVSQKKHAATKLRSKYSDTELDILETRLRMNSFARDPAPVYNPAIYAPLGFGTLVTGVEKNLNDRFYITRLSLQYLTSIAPEMLSKEAQRSTLHNRIHEVYSQINNASIKQRQLRPEIFEYIYSIVIYVYLFVFVPLQVFGATNGYWGLPIVWVIYLIYVIPPTISDWIGDPFQSGKEKLHPPHRQDREKLCASIDFAFDFIKR